MLRAAVLGVLALATAAPAAPAEFYVGAGGSDQGPGTASAPFATLERAREAVRAAPVDQPRRVVVRGSIHRTATFALGKEDSGTQENPIVWQASPGVGDVAGAAELPHSPGAEAEKEIRLTGGVAISPDAWRPVTDEKILMRIQSQARDHVRQVDLQLLGVHGLAPLPDQFRDAPLMPDLFVRDQRMTLARWPNQGWATIASVIDAGSNRSSSAKDRRGGIFEYAETPETRGLDRWDISAGVWLLGYWRFDWAEESIRIKALDPATRRITLAAPHHYGLRPGNPSPRRFRALNLLEELDMPGEYCIDPQAGRLYFWPPADPRNLRNPGNPDAPRVVLGALPGPVVQITDAQHVILRGFVVEATMGNAIEVRGGQDVRIQACHVRNVRQTGIVVSGGLAHRVEACDIHDTGAGGVTLVGGDRKTLTPAGHQAVNNHIWRYAIHKLTYASAIELEGVGNLAAHNLIHDAPHMAVSIKGNDHVFEFNVVHDVCNQSDDSGALYKGRNASCRGNIIRNNFWHHIGNPSGSGTAAIYFDDGDGGDIVIGNVFYRCGEPHKTSFGTIYSNGGYDLMAQNNIFIECKRALGSFDWNDKRWKDNVEGGKKGLWTKRLLEEVDITKPPYTTRYPELVGFLDPKPRRLRVSRAEHNVFVNCSNISGGNWQCDKKTNLTVKDDPGFYDAAKGDFRLRDDSIVLRSLPGFVPIPFEKIGLHADTLRPTVPVERWEATPPTR